MKLSLDLILVIRSGYAKALAAFNHATASATSEQAAAEVVANYLSANAPSGHTINSVSAQTLLSAVKYAMLNASAALDELNVTGITAHREFNWDFWLTSEELAAGVTSALVDAFIPADAAAAAVSPSTVQDSIQALELSHTEIATIAEDATALTDENSSQALSVVAPDSVTATDARSAGINAVMADALALAENQSAAIIPANWADHAIPVDTQAAAISGVVADGVLFTYFAGDYCAEVYGTIADFANEALSSESLNAASDAVTTADAYGALELQTHSDASSPSDAYASLTARAFSDGTASTYFAGDYSLGGYSVTDNYTADGYLAVTGSAPADSFAIGESFSATRQSYSLDPAYFAGDYATTAF